MMNVQNFIVIDLSICTSHSNFSASSTTTIYTHACLIFIPYLLCISAVTVYSLPLLLLLRPSRLESGARDRPGPGGDRLGQPPAADE